MAHKPPGIHETFTYYARRHYNLLGFALNDPSYNDNDPHSNDIDYLIDRGEKIRDNAIEEHYPKNWKIDEEKDSLKTKKLKKEKHILLFELKQEILENVPEKGTDVPRDLEKFIEQFEKGIYGINQKKKYDTSDLPLTKSDIKTINNLFIKIIPNLEKDEKENMQRRTLSEKVDLLRNSLEQPNFKGLYSKREIDSIRALFQKKDEPVSLEEKLNNNEDDDKSQLEPEEIWWRPSFTNVLKSLLNKEEFEKFWALLCDGFLRHKSYRPKLDSKKKFTMTKYAKNKQFENYCSVKSIPTDDKLQKHLFFTAIQQAVDNINNSIKD